MNLLRKIRDSFNFLKFTVNRLSVTQKVSLLFVTLFIFLTAAIAVGTLIGYKPLRSKAEIPATPPTPPTPPNLTLTPGNGCPPGDVNGDCHVTLADYSILFTNFGTIFPTSSFGTCPYLGKGDINCDGKIDLADYSILFTNFGK